MKLFKLVLLLLVVTTVGAQTKQDITLEDIWKNYKFYAQSVYGIRSMNNGCLLYTSDAADE